MAAARANETWEHDNAHQALGQWIYAWRQERPDARQPGSAFRTHIGRDAVELAEGMSKVDVLRLFWALGAAGECPCGNAWDQPLITLEAS